LLPKVFPLAETRRIAEPFEWPYTLKHGSLLNIAECEMNTLVRQCLDRRIPDRDTLGAEMTVRETEWNTISAKVSRRFSTNDARINLKYFYPQID
jgi:hypothetical protein